MSNVMWNIDTLAWSNLTAHVIVDVSNPDIDLKRMPIFE